MSHLFDWIVHFHHHLREVVTQYGAWTYGILFLIIFAETGVVIMPFLPGDSLLFAVGALAGDPSMNLSVTWLCISLTIAAILGDTVNYHLGLFCGPRVFSNPKSFFLDTKHLARTQAFFEKYGGKTIVLARFLPIVRTMAPFVAGVGQMHYGRFLAYNVAGGVVWVVGFIWLGYAFGGLEVVQKNFTLVILGIIVVSVLPAVIEFIRHRSAPAAQSSESTTPE